MIGMGKVSYRAGGRFLVVAACIGFGIALCAAAANAQALSPTTLRVDEMVTPLGIDDTQPRFSWQLRDSRQGARQTAYRLLVSSKPQLLRADKGDVWDSGRVASGQSVAVRYGGPAIAPSTRYFWKVLVWDTDYPSWGYLVGHGATTMWERWNSDQMRGDPSMNSYNHYAYGVVADWIYRYAAGVDATPLDAGFHTVYLHPVFDRNVGSLDFRFQSPYEEIHSSWAVDGDKVHWSVTIPPNTTAWLRVTNAEAQRYTLNESPLASNKLASPSTRDGQAGYELAAGTYRFEVMDMQ